MTSSKETHKVLAKRELGEGSFVLRFERRGFVFKPGQYIHVGPVGGIDQREYSVYSPAGEDYLEILIKIIPHGSVSARLSRLGPGDQVRVEGPFGFFLLEEGAPQRPFLFLATGTGISPFHCFAGSYPSLNYQLVHGTRYLRERYEHDYFDASRVVSCVSGEAGGDYQGRVTAWLRENPPRPDTLVYLCGNCDMIYEAYDIIKEQNIPADQIHGEVYF